MLDYSPNSWSIKSVKQGEVMYLITNRQILSTKKGLEIFGEKPSENGAHDISFFNINKKNDSWKVDSIPEILDKKVVKELKKEHKIDIDINATWNGSLQVACEIFALAKQSKKSILLFIHGYNNDVEDVVTAAEAIEKLYDVIVVPFTWPANGGNFATGAAAYLSDKADARQSSQALNRIVGKIGFYHQLFTDAQLESFRKKLEKNPPKNQAVARQNLTKLQQKICKSKISLLCHSMGNYVLKHTLLTSDSETKKLVFDNICLVAADVNNKNHQRWVEKLDVRNRCYIVINESDAALAASRMKPGEEQLVRLGHYVKDLGALNAYYIDVTDVDGVGSGHTYFKGDAVENNEELKSVFKDIFHGKSVEKKLQHLPDKKLYILQEEALVDEDSFFAGIFD